MIRKTFTTNPEATKYYEDMIAQSNTAVLQRLGDKFRVYVETKEETERMRTWRRDNWNSQDIKNYLRRIAWGETDAVDNVLKIQKSIASGTLYNDYEDALQVARIMAEIGELKTASDVFHFIDATHHYDKVMKQRIEETLLDCDYEGKEEVKVE